MTRRITIRRTDNSALVAERLHPPLGAVEVRGPMLPDGGYTVRPRLKLPHSVIQGLPFYFEIEDGGVEPPEEGATMDSLMSTMDSTTMTMDAHA